VPSGEAVCLDAREKRKSFKIFIVVRKLQLKIWEGRADSHACAQTLHLLIYLLVLLK
jgi:hypothetical protein